MVVKICKTALPLLLCFSGIHRSDPNNRCFFIVYTLSLLYNIYNPRHITHKFHTGHYLYFTSLSSPCPDCTFCELSMSQDVFHTIINTTPCMVHSSSLYRKLHTDVLTLTAMNKLTLNLFPNKPLFLRVCSLSLLRAISSFPTVIFYPFGKLSAIFIKFKTVVYKPFQFGRI